MLEKRGYKLRPRFRPGWKPSWMGTTKRPVQCEDYVSNRVRFLQVSLRFVITTETPRLSILKLWMQQRLMGV